MYSIIGSGIAGLACSYVLSNFDVKNEIFESGDQKILTNMAFNYRQMQAMCYKKWAY